MPGDKVGACTPWPNSLYHVGNCESQFGPEYIDNGDQSCGPGNFKVQHKCRWTGYSAPRYNCCLGLGNDNKRTCDPIYQASANVCDDVYKDYCSKDGKIMNDLKCIEWSSLNPLAAFPMASAYCNNVDALNDTNKYAKCRAWCVKNPGACDSAAKQYCTSVNPQDVFCNCINSAIDANAACFDGKCVNMPGTYRTALQDSSAKHCEPYMRCDQWINLGKDAQNNIIDKNYYQQTCTQNPPTPPSPPSPPDISGGWFNNLTQYQKYFILFIFAIIIGILTVLLIPSEKSIGGVDNNVYDENYS